MFRSALFFACLLASAAPAAPRTWTASEGAASFEGERHDWIFAQRKTPVD